MKPGNEPYAAREPSRGLATHVLLYSVSAQNENELVFDCVLTCYSKLQVLRLNCSKFRDDAKVTVDLSGTFRYF